MIQIIPNKPNKPHFYLSYEFMIGDGDGYHNKEIYLEGYNLDYIEKLYKCLNCFYSYSNIEFEDNHSFKLAKDTLKSGGITQDLFDFFVEDILELKEDYTFEQADRAWNNCNFIARDNYEMNGMVCCVGLLYKDENGNILDTRIV